MRQRSIDGMSDPQRSSEITASDLEALRLIAKGQATARVHGYVSRNQELQRMRRWLRDQGLSLSAIEWVQK